MADLTPAAASVKPPPLQAVQLAATIAEAQNQVASGTRVNESARADPQNEDNQNNSGQSNSDRGLGASVTSSKIAFRDDGQMVIQIIDQKTQAVVREFPSEKLSEIQELTIGGAFDEQG